MISLPWLFFGLCRDLPCFCYFFVSKHLYTFIYVILYVHIQQDQSVSFSLRFYFSLQAWIWSYFCRFHYSCLLVYFHKEFSWVVENYFELLILLSSPRIIGTSSHGYLSFFFFFAWAFHIGNTVLTKSTSIFYTFNIAYYPTATNPSQFHGLLFCFLNRLNLLHAANMCMGSLSEAVPLKKTDSTSLSCH